MPIWVALFCLHFFKNHLKLLLFAPNWIEFMRRTKRLTAYFNKQGWRAAGVRSIFCSTEHSSCRKTNTFGIYFIFFCPPVFSFPFSSNVFCLRARTFDQHLLLFSILVLIEDEMQNKEYMFSLNFSYYDILMRHLGLWKISKCYFMKEMNPKEKPERRLLLKRNLKTIIATNF